MKMTRRSKQSESLKPLLFLSEFRMTWKTILVAQDGWMIQEKHEEVINVVRSSGEYYTGVDSLGEEEYGQTKSQKFEMSWSTRE